MSAQILAFPSARHVRLLPNVVAGMRGCPSLQAAKAHLTWHCDFWWDHLESLGVSDKSCEREIRAFATAACERFFSDGEQGAA